MTFQKHFKKPSWAPWTDPSERPIYAQNILHKNAHTDCILLYAQVEQI